MIIQLNKRKTPIKVMFIYPPIAVHLPPSSPREKPDVSAFLPSFVASPPVSRPRRYGVGPRARRLRPPCAPRRSSTAPPPDPESTAWRRRQPPTEETLEAAAAPHLLRHRRSRAPPAGSCEELSDTTGLEISSHVLSPIVFLKLKKSTGSLTTDLDLLETIAERVESHSRPKQALKLKPS